MDQLALTRQIRFGISELTARNAHHPFEEMCRFLVASRICSNVFPATGPVSAGGDGGRDFQTFRTHLVEQLGPHGGFAGMASAEPIAFACTLQANGIASKIKRDLRRIAAGPKVAEVYVMLGADFPSARADEVKSFAAAEYGIELQILDGQAVAELLASPDTFWIAARWLAIPSEYAPERPSGDLEAPDWYVDTRRHWRIASSAPTTTGEVMSVRAALRRATTNSQARADFGFWLTLMSGSCDVQLPLQVRQRARYEVAVAQLRGDGDLRPADHHIVAFLDEARAESSDWADLMDASVLVQYAAGAAYRGRTSLSAAWIREQNVALRAHVEQVLREPGLPLTSKAGLLSVLAHLCVHTKIEPGDLPAEPLAAWDPTAEEVEAALRDGLTIEATDLVDPQRAVEVWAKFSRIARKAPLVAVDGVADIIGLLTPALISTAGFDDLVGRIDELVAAVGGDAAAAERSRDRAVALLDAEKPIHALRHLHEAKARWWRGDTIRGSVLALGLLARCYADLNLFMASRQQALVAVGLALSDAESTNGDLVASCLFEAAEADYRSGAWCNATETYAAGLSAHLVHREDPWNFERYPLLESVYVHNAYIRSAAAILGQSVECHVARSQDECGLGEVLTATADSVPERSADQWARDLSRDLGVRPFADAGPDRRVTWHALGIEWNVSGVNRYGHARAVERFAAAAQILCAELATEDLVLLPTKIRIRVQIASSSSARGKDRVRRKHGNDGTDWEVDLLPSGADATENDGQVAQELAVALTHVFHDAALIPWSKHREIVERCYEWGLTHKLGAGRPYDEVAEIVPRATFEAFERETMNVPDAWREPQAPEPAHGLQWNDGPGPGYSPAAAKVGIRNRYRRCREILCSTLPRLECDESFLKTYSRARSEGWKDWHVLLALVNARINFRAQLAQPSFEDMRELVRTQKQHAVEDPDEPPLPPEWLTFDRLTELRRMAFLTGAPQWDLELHQPTPDLVALERLLGHRYGYWTDDVSHGSLFSER